MNWWKKSLTDLDKGLKILSELSAAEEVLLAAREIAQDDMEEVFSEWDLTVAAWQLNPHRWGMRGYEEEYPDHKRVMMEVMGRNNLVNKGWLERPKTNHYQITSAGMAKAAEITAPRDTRARSIHIHDAVSAFALHPVFESHLEDEEKPKTWMDAEAFLQLRSHDGSELEERFEQLRESIERALEFIETTEVDVLRRGDRPPAISRERLERLSRFLDLLEERFSRQISAIRKRSS